MDIEGIMRLLLSQPAVAVYEVLAMAALLLSIVLLTKKRRQRKEQSMAAQERQARESLDGSLSNQRRR